MTEKKPIKLADGGYQFPDGIIIKAADINLALRGMTRDNIELMEHVSGKPIHLMQAEVLHNRVLRENEEKERALREERERQERKIRKEIEAGKKLFADGRILVIKGGEVLDTLPDLTETEARTILYSSYSLNGLYQDKVNYPVYEIHLPSRYPEYVLFIRSEKGVEK